MNSVRWARTLTLTAVVLAVGAGQLLAQSAVGSLRGTVRDAQGVIPGATVTMTSQDTGTTRETVTNGVGEYSFPAVNPGDYTIAANVTGYKTFERRGVHVGLQQAVTLDIPLEVGAVQESITVTGQAPLVETSNASTGDVLDKKQLDSLPTIGRNVYLLSVTVPTVVSSGDTHWNRMQDQTGSSLVSLGGGGVRANNYLIDGFPTTDMLNRSSTVPSLEATEEVKVQVHTYDAEMGRTGGGTFNAAAKSGTNEYHGAGFFQWRPLALSANQYFLDLQGVPKPDSYWHDFGGGFGGPIIHNKTFFWFAGEGYRDGLPQNGNLIMPTAAEKAGNFAGLTAANGTPVILYDPLTTDPVTGNRQPFPGNVIPANRINPVAAKMLGYLPSPSVNADTGVPNYFASDVLVDQAQQLTGKVNHNINDKISLSGFYLWQLTHEPYNNFNHQYPFASTSYQLNRTIGAFVLNNTYVLNSSTVMTLRYGWNKFDDGDSLPYPFDVSTLGFSQNFVNQVPLSKFPAFDLTGYNDQNTGLVTGFTGKVDNHYHSYGFNGALTKLAGSHSVKFGADYRLMGVDSLSYGQSSGTFTFTGQFTGSNANSPAKNTGNAVADLLLGYPWQGAIPLTTPINAFLRYYGGYAQDDWRVNSKLSVNYGLRVEHETGLMEQNNAFTVGFDTSSVVPQLQGLVSSPNPVTGGVMPVDPITGQQKQIVGGLIFAGQNGANTYQGNPPAIKVSPRLGAVYNMNEKTAIRGGYGIFWAPWNYPSPGTSSYGQFGYSSNTNVPQTPLVPSVSLDNPFPTGLTPPTTNTLGLLTNVGSNVNFVDPNKGAPRVQQYSVDYERELGANSAITIGYVGSKGTHLGYGGTADASININQLPAQYLTLGSQLTKQVPNPFYGYSQFGAFGATKTIAYGQLLRPFPQFGNVQMRQTTGARSLYNAAVIEFKKRPTGWWGGNINYTYSKLKDDQFAQSNYYSSTPTAGQILDNYDPNATYGTSMLDMPHKVVISPMIRSTANKTGAMGYLVNGWNVSAIIQFQSGFPILVAQTPNNSNLQGSGQRPNLVPGVPLILNSDITSTLNASNGTNGQYLNPDAFSLAPAFTFGNAPRTLDARTPWRNETDLAIAKDFSTGGSTRAQIRVELINLFNQPWFVGFNTTYGASGFGQITTQGNYSRVTQITFRWLF